jgi:hypothetical protein
MGRTVAAGREQTTELTPRGRDWLMAPLGIVVGNSDYVPRITPITVRPHQSDESLPLGFGHSRDAHPLLRTVAAGREQTTELTPRGRDWLMAPLGIVVGNSVFLPPLEVWGSFFSPNSFLILFLTLVYCMSST